MSKEKTAVWVVKLAFVNLMVLAFLGVVLRYKIAFSLPFIQQKHLLHAHSHFAFSGWVGQMIMTCILLTFKSHFSDKINSTFQRILILNSLFSYAQLIAFTLQGYGLYSIVFSSITTLLSYYFGIKYWQVCNKSIHHLGAKFFKAAIVFNMFSSLGTGSLVYLMINHISYAEWYLASVYFFLHFQYNGFFIFSIVGFFFTLLYQWNVPVKNANKTFWTMAISLPFAYLLSIIWANLPWYIYTFAVIAALVQFSSWIHVLRIFLINNVIQKNLKGIAKWLIWIAFFAGTIKFTLQLLSVIPSVSQYAFGFRPIVIAYLHLVLLGFVSLFLIGYFIQNAYLTYQKGFVFSVIFFLLGILGNEVILMFQGLSFFGFWSPSHSNELLLGMAVLMFFGLVGMNFNISNKNSY